MNRHTWIAAITGPTGFGLTLAAFEDWLRIVIAVLTIATLLYNFGASMKDKK